MFIVALLCIQVPIASSDWKPVEISPTATLYFPVGGGTCTTALKLPRDGTVNDVRLNISGKPVITNSTFNAGAGQLWNESTQRTNVTMGPEGIGLGGFGGWWEETAAEAWARAPAEDREGWRTVGVNGSLLDNWTYDQNAGGLRLAREFEKAFVPDAATVGLWHFDEGAGASANDSSGLGNDGALMGGTTWTNGRFGTGLLFDGENGLVEVPDANSLSSPKDLTIECWVNTNVRDAYYRPLVTKYNGQNAGSEYTLFLQDGAGQGQIVTASSYSALNAGPLPLEGWYYFAMTYDGVTAKLFLNGELVTAAPFNQYMANTDTPVGFGRNCGGPATRSFQGILDDIRISNAARPISKAYFSDSASLLSPTLNVSAYSRIMVQGDFPEGTNYSVDVLDPAENNTTLQMGLRNGDELNLSLWDGLETPYRNLVMRLNLNTTDINITPILRKWGIGTDVPLIDNKDLLNISGVTLNNNIQLTRGNEGIWLQKASGSSARQYQNAVWDPEDQQMLVFGGYDGSNYLNDLWAYSSASNSWAQKASGCTGREAASAVWDPDDKQMLVFGGCYGSTYLNDLWAYSPASNSWVQKASGSTSRGSSTAIWDSNNKQMLVFGGYGNGNCLNDLWAYSPSSNTWTQKSSGSTPRYDHSAVWDPDNKQMLIFGGYNGGALNDLWAYSPSNDDWVQKASTMPRAVHSAIWEPESKQMLVFGGWDGSNNLNDLWAYSPSNDTWAQMKSGSTARYAHIAVWDPENGQMLVFGGYNGGALNDLWAYWLPYQFSGSIVYNATPFLDTYGNIFVNATCPPGTDYWVNVTDIDNSTLLSDLKNGDPLLLNATEYPSIKLELNLITNDPTITPVVHRWGFGTTLFEWFNSPPANFTALENGAGLALGRNNWTLSPEFNVSTESHNQAVPAIAANLNNDYLVAWYDDRANVGDENIYAQMFKPDGTLSGPEITVADTPGSTADQVIASNSKGEFIVAWQDRRSGHGHIYVQKFDATGAKTGPEVVASQLTGQQWFPAIAVDSRDNVIVTWQDDSAGANQWNIYAQRLDPQLILVGPMIEVCTANDVQMYPDIAVDTKDNFIIAWEDRRSGSYNNIYVRGFDKNGIQIWAEDSVSNSPFDQHDPALAVDSNDRFMVTWGDSRNGANSDIYAKIFDSVSGATLSKDVAVCIAPGDQDYPAIKVDSFNEFMITWQDQRQANYNIYVKLFDSETGKAIGAEIGVSIGASDRMYPTLAFDIRDECIITWMDSRYGNWDILACRLNNSYFGSGAIDSTWLLPSNPSMLVPEWEQDTPPNTTINVTLRLSDNGENWSKGITVFPGMAYLPSNFSRPGPYLEYNITLESSDGNLTPRLQDFTIGYRPFLVCGTIDSGIIATTVNSFVDARPTLDSSTSLGSKIDILLSSDGGASWQMFIDQVKSSFNSKGDALRWRLNFKCDGNWTPILRYLIINCTIESFPSNISIDVGNDSSVEWRFNGSLNATVQAGGLSTALNAYVQAHHNESDIEGYIAVPLNFASRTSGIIIISADADISPFYPRIIGYGPIGEDIIISEPIKISFSEQMNASSVNITITPDIALIPSWDGSLRNLTLGHSDFEDNTIYNVTIRAGALSLVGIGLEENFSWEFTTMLLPRITDFSPTGDNVPLNNPVRLRFNGPMNESSVNVTIDPPVSLIPFWFGYHDNLSLAHQDFQPDTSYNVTVAPGARFDNGAMRTQAMTWEFRTVPRPKILSYWPTGMNVPLEPPILITFSEKMVASSVIVQIDPKLALNTVWSPDGRNLTLGHNDFQEDTNYNITVQMGAASANGARLETGFSWEFTTILIPRVVSFSPTGVNIPLSSHFSLEFNKPMNLSALINATEIDPPVKGEWKAVAEGRIFNFMPASKLRSNTDYSIVLHGNVTDLDENQLGKDSNWAFTTVQGPVSANEGFLWWPLVIVILVVLLSIAIYYNMRKARGQKKQTVTGMEEANQVPLAIPKPVTAAMAPPPEALPVPESDIIVITRLEYDSDHIELVLSITNRMRTKMEKTVLKLVYDENVLTLIQVRPGYTVKGDDILIGVVEPQAAVNLTVEYKPSALMKSEIEGVLVFKDRHGPLQTVNIPPVSIVLERPELLTDTNITTTKMMRRIVEDLDFSGTRLFAMPPDIRPQQAFELGKAAVQRHDFRLVDQFSEKNPYIGEAWFYGLAKRTQDKLVVRVRFIGSKGGLEFFVLSTSASLLTAMTLSLKTDLVSELIANDIRPSIKEVTDPEETTAVTSMRTLLDKELGADK